LETSGFDQSYGIVVVRTKTFSPLHFAIFSNPIRSIVRNFSRLLSCIENPPYSEEKKGKNAFDGFHFDNIRSFSRFSQTREILKLAKTLVVKTPSVFSRLHNINEFHQNLSLKIQIFQAAEDDDENFSVNLL
jgi:hypothetical protein